VREELSKFISNSGLPADLQRHPPAHRGAACAGRAKTLHEISRLPLGEARNYFNCLTTDRPQGAGRRQDPQGNHRAFSS
jgi:excinuclease ABC subunit A